MATVTRPTDALPDPGDALKAEPIRDHIANILTFIESNNIDSSNVDYSSTDGIMVLDQAQTVTGAKNFSTSILLSGSAVVDLNGIADSLVLDEDADTTISSPTDDQIDIEVGGSDLYKFTATAFVSGSNIVSDTTNTDSLGTTALTWSDLYLGDASVLAFGEDQDVTLTHDPDDGIFLNAGMKLGFRDMGGEYIYSVSDGTLGIAAATEVDITTTTLDVNGAVDISGATAIGGTLNVGASTAIANVKDEDNMSSNSATSLATQQSIKAYVDSQVAGADTLTELTDTNITSAADASMLLYDTGTSRWIDNVMSGDATMADTGAVTLAGTNTNLTTLANVTTVGTIGTGTWQGTKVASAYLDDQTAHLNETQSFTGAKTFGAASQFNSTITVGADDAGYDVIFYGNTASANATWDTSADDLILSGAAGLIVPDGQLTLGSTAVTSTAAELNLIDGATSRGTTAVASGDGILINDAGTMRMTNVDTVSTYFSSHSVGGSNIVTVGTVTAGTWQGNKVASAYLDDQTAHLNATQSFTGAKTFGAATQFNSTVTVGANDAGYDVILYGNTASANVTWDASEDDLIANGAARIVVPDGQMVLGSTAISSTAAEINLLDALSRGSIIYGNASGATTVLTKGGSGTVLTSDGTDISWAAAAGGGHTIQEEGSGLTQRSNLNFVGAGVTATDNSGADTTIVTIGASGASLPVTRSDGSTSDPIALTSAAIGESLVTDTSPQLGGNLDVNGQSIVSDSGNENIPITPHGTGSVVISKADINGGAIDATTIGAGTPSTIAGTTLSATGNVSLDGGSFVFNESGADKDFRIEGDTEQNLFFADASTDRIGIGTSSPTDTLNVHFSAASMTEGLVLYNENTAGFGPAIRFESDYSNSRKIHSAINGNADGSGGALSFHTSADNSALVRHMIIKPDGNVGIGTSNPAGVGGSILDIKGSGTNGASLSLGTTTAVSNARLYSISAYSATTECVRIETGTEGGVSDAGAISFDTKVASGALTRRMTINSTGLVGIGTTTPSMALEVTKGQNGGWASRMINSGDSTPYVLWLRQSATSNADTKFLQCTDNASGDGNMKFIVYGDGDVVSATNSYTSDAKLKQDIVDVRSYWDDFKSVRFRKFRFKSDVALDENAPLKFGVVAQEIEELFPSLVNTRSDTEYRLAAVLDDEGNPTYEQTQKLTDDGDAVLDSDGNAVMIDDPEKPVTKEQVVDLGTTTKSVKYSVLNSIGLKVVQELQTRLEAAEAKITALESA